MNSSEIKTIGFTGHKDIRAEDTPIIKARIREKIQQLLKESPGACFKVICGNAEGGDRLLIDVLEEWGASGRIAPEIVRRNEGERNEDYYERLAKTILGNSAKTIIAVWNGIFNGKPNGTSDIVKKALEHQTIHHLICPRISNPIPVNSIASHAIDYDAKQFTRIPFTVNFTWQTIPSKAISPKQRVYNEHIWPFYFNYVIPICLALLTLILGWLGFAQYSYCHKNGFNNLFKAVNLITLNSAILESDSNTFLDIARILGLVTFVYAFSYALVLAFRRHRQNFRRKLWKGFAWRLPFGKYWHAFTLRLGGGKGFVLVLGLNEKSMSLIKSLAQKQERVVLLTEHENSVYDYELKRLKKLIIVRGSLSSATMLEYLYATSAKEIYLISANDSKNVRAAQELDILFKQKESGNKPKVFVHLLNEEHNKFLRDSLNHIGNETTIFNIYENIVRRLFLYFPPDRFYLAPHSHTLHTTIIGFDKIGQELLLQLLRQAHYQKDKKVKIAVYCSNAADCQKHFQNQYPLVFRDDNDSIPLQEIKEAVWQNISLSFIELPQSDAVWLDDEQPLYKDIDEKHILTVYTGLDNGIAAASYLKSILPKLNHQQQNVRCDTQVFCYYNLPDRKEQANIESYLNKEAPDLFIKCFGNFIDECGIQAVKSMALDELAMLINAFYTKGQEKQDEIFKQSVAQWKGFSEEEANDPWLALPTRHKMSSRLAGDHLWTKLRILHTMKNWDFDALNYHLDEETELLVLAETEHRRWSAELLLQGFVPFNIITGSKEYIENAIKWNDQKEGISAEEAAERKAFKKANQQIKRHIDLVPIKKLYEDEARKDYNQIKAIPYFLKQMLPKVFHTNDNIE